MTGARAAIRMVLIRLSRRSPKQRRYRQGGVEGGGRKYDPWSIRCRFRFQTRHVHTFASSSSPPCPSTTSGNQPNVPKSTLISPVRPSVTSTPSASRASRCRCAPSVPGPRELIVPEDAITLCQGTGGSISGDSHFRARAYSG